MVLLVTTGHWGVLGGTGVHWGVNRGTRELPSTGGYWGYWGYWGVIENTVWYCGALWGTAGTASTAGYCGILLGTTGYWGHWVNTGGRRRYCRVHGNAVQCNLQYSVPFSSSALCSALAPCSTL